MAYFYIKPYASGGRDTYGGTSWADAWATTDPLWAVYPATGPLANGDTVVIRTGTYTPTLTIAIWRNHITLISEARATALGLPIDGSGYIPGTPIISGASIDGSTPYSSDILALDVPGNRSGGTENDCHGFLLDGINLTAAIRNAFWTSCATGGTRAYNEGHEVRYSTIYTTAANGVYARQANDFYLHDVELHHNGDGVEANLVHAVYINNSDNILIEHLLVHDTLNGGSVHLNGDRYNVGTVEAPQWVQGFMTNAVVRESKFWNNKGVDIDLYNAVGGTVENNVVYSPLLTTTHDNHLVRVGWDVALVPFRVPSTGVVVANNTLICNATRNDAINLMTDQAKNCIVFNNIMATADGTLANAVAYGAYDNHTIHASNKPVNYTTGNLAAWFVGYGSGNFDLKLASPFQDTGASTVVNSVTGTVFAPLTDYAGRVRPQGAGFDTGAYEYPVAGPTVYGRVTAVNAVATYTELPWERASFAPLQTFQLEDYRIDFMSWSGTRKDSVQRASGYNPLVKLEFELLANGGCGDATITLLRERVPSPPRATQFGYLMEPGNIVDVWLHSWYFGDTLSQWYRGVITKVDDPEGFADTIEIKAEGLWNLLDKRVITKYYEGKAINAMVADILADVCAESRISTSTAGISVAAPYTIGDVEFELTSAADAIAALASVQGNIQYGVDPSGLFYFKDLDTSVKHTAQIGLNISAYEKNGEATNVANHYLLQAKQLVGGANLILSKEDSTSIATYGRRTKLVQVTGLQNISDLARYGQSLLDDTKIYNDHVSVDVVGDVYYLFPRGDCRIVKLDKSTFTLPIQSVKYTFDQNGRMRFGLGDAPVTTLPDEVRRIGRQIAVGKQSSMSNTKIEHTANDEWSQGVRLDAGKQGNLTLYYDIFGDTKALDLAHSSGFAYDSTRCFLRGAPSAVNSLPLPCTVQSQAIPIGVQVDTIRVYANVNLNGTIDFNFSEDVNDFFTQPDQGTGLWAVSDIRSSVYDTRDPAGSFLTFDGDKYIYPTIYFVRLKGWTQLVTTTGEAAWIIWNYDPATSYYHYLKIYDVGTTAAFELKTYQGTHVSVNGPVLSNNVTQIDLEVRHSGTGLTKATLSGGGITRGTLTGSLSSYAFRPPKLYNFGNPANPQPWVIDSIGLTRLTKCDIYISRDGGTTWTLAVASVDGESAVDINVAGQPAGSTIQLKAVMNYPSRLNGWGWSCKTA